VAPDIFSTIDTDADGRVSGPEAEAYARRVLADLAVEADGRAVSLVLMRADVPSRDELADGMGTIRIDAIADGAPASAGRHRLDLRNDHEPGRSVYLANALMPRAPGVAIASQIRDPRQRQVRIEYDIEAETAGHVRWVFAGALSLAALAVFRRRERWAS
jgi:hypothetical protein